MVVAAVAALGQALGADPDIDGAVEPVGATLAVLALLFLICDSAPTTLTSRQSAWSPSSSATLAAVVLLGPLGALVVGATSLLSVRRGLRPHPAGVQRVDVRAQSPTRPARPTSCSAARSAMPGYAVLPRHHRPVRRRGGRARVHQLRAAVGHADARPARGAGQSGRAARRHIPLLFLSDLGYASLGLLIAALWGVGLGAFAAILVLVPLFVARWAMGQFAAQERAYAATMAALCQAVETKDFYTSGHSERVARGSAMIARRWACGAAASRRSATPACCTTWASSACPRRCSRRAAR